MAKAWELLSDPAKWTQGRDAEDANGMECRPRSRNARSWCAIGAIVRCYGSDDAPEIDAAYAVAWKRHKRGIRRVNDELGYDAVLAVLKEADV